MFYGAWVFEDSVLALQKRSAPRRIDEVSFCASNKDAVIQILQRLTLFISIATTLQTVLRTVMSALSRIWTLTLVQASLTTNQKERTLSVRTCLCVIDSYGCTGRLIWLISD